MFDSDPTSHTRKRINQLLDASIPEISRILEISQDSAKKLIECVKDAGCTMCPANKPGVVYWVSYNTDIGNTRKFIHFALSIPELKRKVDSGAIRLWTSYYNTKTWVFLKNTSNRESRAKDRIDSDEHEYYDYPEGLTDAFDRDEIGDPDLLENWDDEAVSRYGKDGLSFYRRHGFFPDDDAL